MISCEEAQTICHKNQYREATLRERWRLWLHLIRCRSCAGFSRKNTKLTDLCDQASLRELSEEDKEGIKNRLREAEDQ